MQSICVIFILHPHLICIRYHRGMRVKRRTIPNRLRRFRKQMGLTQTEVATLLSLKHTTRIILWEQGKSIPSFINILKLSVIYHCYPHELYPELFTNLYGALHNKTEEFLLAKHFNPHDENSD